MGYDGRFTKIRMKLDNQEQLDNYYVKARNEIFDTIGRNNFYKFEGFATNLRIDNDWTEAELLSKVVVKAGGSKLKNYEVDACHYTYISKDILKNFIDELKNMNLSDYYDLKTASETAIKELEEDICNDIKKLEKLHKEFDWENDTLVFSYDY